MVNWTTIRLRHFDHYYRLIKSIEKQQAYEKVDMEIGQLQLAFRNALTNHDMESAYSLLKISSGFFARKGLNTLYISWCKDLFSSVNLQPDHPLHPNICNQIGRAFRHNLSGDQVSNLYKAISYFDQGLVHCNNCEPNTTVELYYNRGNAFRELASFSQKKENLNLAFQSYHHALNHINAESAPLLFGKIMHTKGLAYFRLSELEDQEKNLKRSIHDQQIALKYRTEDHPVDHALTLNAIALARYEYAQLQHPYKNLLRAKSLFERGLSFISTSKDRRSFSGMYRNLANAIRELGKLQDSPEQYMHALATYNVALESSSKEDMPYDYALILMNVGVTHWYLGNSVKAKAFLIDARKIFYRLEAKEDIIRIDKLLLDISAQNRG